MYFCIAPCIESFSSVRDKTCLLRRRLRDVDETRLDMRTLQVTPPGTEVFVIWLIKSQDGSDSSTHTHLSHR